MSYTPSMSDLQSAQASPAATPANASANYTPSMADLKDAHVASLQQTAPSGQQVPQDDSNSLGSYAAATTAGINNFGIDVGETAASAITYLPSKVMQHLGIIAPETANNIQKAISESADSLRVKGDVNSSDPFEKATGQHPILAGGLRAAGDIYTGGKVLTAGGEAATVLGDSLGTTAASLGAGSTAMKGTQIVGGIAARAASMGTIGQAMDSNPDTKTSGFILNAALSPAIDGAGKLISYAGTKIGVVDSLKNLVDSANEKLRGLTTDERMGGAISNSYGASKAVENKWYDAVKSTDFNQGDQAKTYNLGREVHDFIYTNGDKLSQVQKGVLQDTADGLATAGSHENTLNLLQSLGAKYNQFSGLNASDSIYDFFKGTQSNLRNIITDAAEREGNGAAMARANLIHERMIKPMQDMGADDITQAVQKYGMGSDEVKQATNNIINKFVDQKGVGKITELLNASGNEGSNIISQHVVKSLFDQVAEDTNFNYSTASKKLGIYISKYDGILSTPAMESLKGAQKIMNEAGTSLDKSSLGGWTAHLVGGAVGGEAANKLSGGNTTAITAGSIAGVIGGPIVLKTVQTMITSPVGQDFLRALANPGVKMGAIRDVIKAMGVEGISRSTNQGNTQ